MVEGTQANRPFCDLFFTDISSEKSTMTLNQTIIWNEEMKIEVPFYRQTMDFTCGAACLLMVLSFYDREFSMNRDAEIDIWREGTSVEVLGMGRYGLSFPLLRRGYRVSVRTSVEGPEFLERIRTRLGEQEMKTFLELYAERMERVVNYLPLKREACNCGPHRVLPCASSPLRLAR